MAANSLVSDLGEKEIVTSVSVCLATGMCGEREEQRGRGHMFVLILEADGC